VSTYAATMGSTANSDAYRFLSRVLPPSATPARAPGRVCARPARGTHHVGQRVGARHVALLCHVAHQQDGDPASGWRSHRRWQLSCCDRYGSGDTQQPRASRDPELASRYPQPGKSTKGPALAPPVVLGQPQQHLAALADLPERKKVTQSMIHSKKESHSINEDHRRTRGSASRWAGGTASQRGAQDGHTRLGTAVAALAPLAERHTCRWDMRHFQAWSDLQSLLITLLSFFNHPGYHLITCPGSPCLPTNDVAAPFAHIAT
jgi:hypothetical protein